jgi:hypothetical protein
MTAITVTIDVDRAAAILAGKATYGPTVVVVDPGTFSADQRDELARLGDDPVERKHLVLSAARNNVNSVGYTTPIVEPTPEAIATALDERRTSRTAREAAAKASAETAKAKEKSRAEELVRTWIAKPLDRRYDSHSHGTRELASNHPRYVESHLDGDLLIALKAAVEETNAEVERVKLISAANVERNREAHAERERIKVQALEDFIQAHSTETQRRRRAAKLMPDDEVLDLVRNHVFSPLDHMPRYERMKKSEFQHAYSVNFETEDAERATDAQYEAMEAIRKLVPGSQVTLRDHIAKLSTDENNDERIVKEGYLVSVGWHGHPLSREYAA